MVLQEKLVTVGMVEQLSKLAELELGSERIQIVAEQLELLLVEANAVNRFMDGRRTVQPGIRFHHPDLEEHAY
jgi:Asp-tRNA(Asn)/Glu-tRNA(Gln) amidotransferase C subunit